MSKLKYVVPRKVCCASCGDHMATIEGTEKLFQGTDSEGYSHIVPVGHKVNLTKALKAKGLTLVGEWETLPSNQTIYPTTCEKCEAVLKRNAEMVLAGGVFFKCEECEEAGRPCTGVIPKGDLALGIRDTLKVEDVNELGNYPPCVIAIKTCAEHTINKPKSSDTADEQPKTPE